MATTLPKPPTWRWWHWMSARRIRTWTPTAAGWLAGAAVAALFVTEWRVIVTRIPFIRGRYPVIEEPKKEEEETNEAAED